MKKTVLFGGLILLLLVVVLSGCETFVGKAYAGPCTDSDSGRVYTTKGTVDGYNQWGDHIVTEDYCLNANLGVESYCDAGGYKAENFQCSNSDCVEGACQTFGRSICTDSDDGKDYNRKGTITGTESWTGDDNKEFSDRCIDPDLGVVDSCVGKPNCKVEEYFCRENMIYYEPFVCSSGCVNGACVLSDRTINGTISATSVPSGALVQVDGYSGVIDGVFDWTYETPINILVDSGNYMVKFTKNGYMDSANFNVVVTAGATTQVSATLTGTTGTISATSVPTDALVYVDGTYKGTTPKTITGVNVGTHAVKFKKIGYANLIKDAVVTAGTTTDVSATLVRN